MEITNEIKAKVFAQYLGQMIELDNSGSKVRNRKLISVGGIDDEEYLKLRMGEAKDGFTHVCFVKSNECKLILKNISDITNEYAIEFTKLQQEGIGKNIENIKIGFHIDEKNNGCLDCIIEWDGYSHDYWQPVYSPSFQYLQSKGYDLPQYLLGGKTLQECGLAVY